MPTPKPKQKKTEKSNKNKDKAKALAKPKKALTEAQKNKKSGPYKTVIDYETLDSLCGIFCTGEECAAILKMDYDTLNRRLGEEGHGGFTDYFKVKSSTGKMSLRRAQFNKATEGNPTMLIWMGKQHLEQFEYTKPNFEDAHPKMPEDENNNSITPDELRKFASWFDDNY